MSLSASSSFLAGSFFMHLITIPSSRVVSTTLILLTEFLGQFILVAARGWTPALQFALEESRVRGAQLLVLYIREVAVNIDMGSNWQDDPDAKVLFTRLEHDAVGLKVNKLYSVSDSPADTIIDIAATFGVDSVSGGGALT